MDEHRYKVGETVRLMLWARTSRTAPNSFQIVGLLPSNGLNMQYRIRNTAEPYDRIATENQLVAAA